MSSSDTIRYPRKVPTWDGRKYLRYVQLKLSGTRLCISMGPDAIVRVHDPAGVNMTHYYKCYGWMLPMLDLPLDTMILGMNYEGDKFLAYAVPKLEGKDVSDWSLEDMTRWFRFHGIASIPWFHYRGETKDELLRGLPQRGAGFVLKDGNLIGWHKLERSDVLHEEK